MAIALGKLGLSVALPVTWTSEAQRLAARFRGQLDTQKTDNFVPISNLKKIIKNSATKSVKALQCWMFSLM